MAGDADLDDLPIGPALSDAARPISRSDETPAGEAPTGEAPTGESPADRGH